MTTVTVNRYFSVTRHRNVHLFQWQGKLLGSRPLPVRALARRRNEAARSRVRQKVRQKPWLSHVKFLKDNTRRTVVIFRSSLSNATCWKWSVWFGPEEHVRACKLDPPKILSLILGYYDRYSCGQYLIALLDCLPERLSGLRNLSHITTTNLRFELIRKSVHPTGPSGSTFIHSPRISSETVSDTTDRQILPLFRPTNAFDDPKVISFDV